MTVKSRDGELHAGLRALGRSHDDVRGLLAFLERLGDVDLGVLRGVGVGRIVRHDHLGHQDAARRRHERRGEEVGQVARAEQARVGGEDGPRDPGHADAHYGEQPRWRKRGEIRAHNQRRFGLADENVRRGGK